VLNFNKQVTLERSLYGFWSQKNKDDHWHIRRHYRIWINI
jgi:hypothetical protein